MRSPAGFETGLQKICESFWDDQGVETVLEKNVESFFFVSFPFRVSPPQPLPTPSTTGAAWGISCLKPLSHKAGLTFRR